MKIGIVGFGKMGREIFELFHSTYKADKIIVLCRHDASEHESQIIRNLGKSLKRKRISEEEYKIRSENFKVSQNIDELKDCDLIVEAISENAEKKNILFSELDKIAKNSCIFASNTSSVSIEKIFSQVSDKSRCIGMHFFYPVKFNRYIELNLHSQTSEKTLDEIQKVIRLSGKSDVVFSSKYHMYINQFIMYCISTAILLSKKYDTGINASAEVLSELFPMHGIYGMIDSIGLELLTTDQSCFSLERIQPVVKCGRRKMTEWLSNGCPGGPGEFISYFSETDDGKELNSEDRQNFIADMAAAVINEAVKAAKDVGESSAHQLIDALEKTVGFADEMKSYYGIYGYCKISKSLAGMEEFYKMDTYAAADESLFKKYL